MDYQDMQTEESEMMQPKPDQPFEYQAADRPVNPGTAPKQPPNNMATASLVLGILVLVTFCCYYTVLPLGGLSILFGLLSRPEGRFTTAAKAGMIMAVIAMVLTVLFWILLFAWIQGYAAGPAVRNLPVIPSLPDMTPGPDNVLTALWQLPVGGVR